VDPIGEDRDIIIVGGGPAGLSAAIHLAARQPDRAVPQAGAQRILVLEKAHYPRRKLCAGGLVADAEIILQRLGLDVSEVPHVDAEAARFEFAGRGLTVRRWGTHTLRIVRRDEFDAWLAGKTRDRGIEIREGIAVRDLRVLPDCVLLETDEGAYRAKIVIGADGSNGVTRHAVLPGVPVSTARLLEVIVPPASPAWPRKELASGQEHASRLAYFDFFPVPQGIAGYVWDFPTRVNGQEMRCWGIYDTNLLADMSRPRLKDPLREEMMRHGLTLDDRQLEGHPIRWFSPFGPLSVPRVLLVGDAAGADPLFGEGISVALGYGKVAAIEADTALRHGDFRFGTYKRRLLLSPLGQTLIARWLLGQFVYSFHWAWFQALLWRILKPFVWIGAQLLVLNWARRMK
jgi:flavin-dependent dehydrogenase